MRLGAHVSIAGKIYLSFERAAAIGCRSMQMFIGNPRSWQPPEYTKTDIAEFNRRREVSGIRPIAIHLPYLVNLCSPKDELRDKSVKAVTTALGWAKLLGADFLVTHFGSHLNFGKKQGMAAIKSSLKEIIESSFGGVRLLLENTSGAGYCLGFRLDDFQEIFEFLGDDKRVGICFDTCHAYAAGYDLSSEVAVDKTIETVRKSIGLDKLGFVHLNDCRGQLGSRIDRHEHIGKGGIGVEGFRRLISHPLLADLGAVIETPKKGPDDDPRNLEILRSLAAD